MAEPIFLKQNIEQKALLEGKISGVAYSGAVIPRFNFYQNFIVDISTLSIAKPKTPILRDHNPSFIAGHSAVKIEGNQVLMEGTISKKTSYGQEIMSLSEDGFEWEMSIGVFDGMVEEILNEEVNGIMVEHGFALRNGVLRETSIVALGADSATSATILSQNKGEPKMFMDKSQWVKFACACGGHKDSTPEELEAASKTAKLASEEDKAKIEALNKELEEMKVAIAAKEAEIAAIKDAEVEEENSASLSAALSAKNITFAPEKIKEAAKSKEKTATLLSLIEGMDTQVKKIDAKLSGKVVVGDEGNIKGSSKEETIRMQARELVKSGAAKDMLTAISMVEVK